MTTIYEQATVGKAYIDALKALHVPRGSKGAKKRPRTALISEAAKRKIAERERSA